MPTNGNSFVKDEVTGYLEPTHHTDATPFGVESKKRFIKLLEEEGDFAKVCDLLGVSTRTYYTHLGLDEAFARDIAMTVQRMASHLEGSFYKKGLTQSNGFVYGIAWLRKNLPHLWNPKTSISVSSDSADVDTLFKLLRDEGKLIDVPASDPD